MKKTIVIICVACIGLALLSINEVKRKKTACRLEKELVVYSGVRIIIKDPSSPSLKLIVLTNGDTLHSAFNYGLWIGLDAGDSIVKQAGTLRYRIYSELTPIVDTVFSEVDCESIPLRIL